MKSFLVEDNRPCLLHVQYHSYRWPCEVMVLILLSRNIRVSAPEGQTIKGQRCFSPFHLSVRRVIDVVYVCPSARPTRQIWGIWKPIVRKRPIWVKIGDVLSRVTLKFDGWPWKTIGNLFFAVSSFVQHFIAIGEFKLELQSGNAQFESNSTIFRAMWPWNLTDDLEKQ